jgi:hypothetical protein
MIDHHERINRVMIDRFKLVADMRRKLAEEITLPIKVAVMGCVVNGPGECEEAVLPAARPASAGAQPAQCASNRLDSGFITPARSGGFSLHGFRPTISICPPNC